MAKLSAELQRVFLEEATQPKVSVQDILNLTQERAFGLLFVLLSFPSALPLPAPGYSTPFGIVLLLLAVQMVVGARQPWLPDKILRSSMDLKQLQGVLRAGLPWLRRVESVSRPRISYVCTSFPGRVVLGVAISLMAISMIIPIPGTNTLPAMAIFLTGFGLLEDDGLISIVGLLLCLCLVGLVTALVVLTIQYGPEAADIFKDWVKNTLRSLFSPAQPN